MVCVFSSKSDIAFFSLFASCLTDSLFTDSNFFNFTSSNYYYYCINNEQYIRAVAISISKRDHLSPSQLSTPTPNPYLCSHHLMAETRAVTAYII